MEVILILSSYYVQQAKFRAMTNLKLSNPLIMGNTTEDFTAAECEGTSLRGNIYDLIVDYSSLDLSKLMAVQSYLMKKYNISSA